MKEEEIKKGWQEVSREKNKKFIKKDKADIRVGGYVGYFNSKKEKCEECRQEIFFLDSKEDMKDMLKSDVTSVCPKCALKKDMPPKQREILEFIVKKWENENATLRED